ncbi:MAG: hypothetical protein LUE20_10390 [Oscillospiraceae bacterium]|nr:hypothetical protein [Oscillospiraceae bacterium]
MKQVNLNNPIEIRTVGYSALEEALGPVGTTLFIKQQFDPLGHGDYTKEKYNNGDISIEEAGKLMRAFNK